MTQSHSYPSPARAWWAMTVLFIAYTFSFIDRTILALLVEPLRRDLGLSDTEISLLHGLAFAIFYSTMGVPIAVLADRRSRRAIIGVGVFFWSVMTVLCGFAGTFWKMFAARLGVGVGEAALTPATYSLVADLFPEHLRGRALGFFAGGIHIGAGLALIVGGTVVSLAANIGIIETPLGDLRSWQLVFVVVGAPGILVALLAATIPEPRRMMPVAASAEAPGELGRFLKAHKTGLAAHFVGFSICGMVFGGFSAWAPTYFIRVHGYTPAEAGQALGIAILVAGTLGALAGGALSDRWADRPNGALRVGLVGLTMQVLTAAPAALVSDDAVAIALFCVLTFFGGFAYPAGASGLQKATPGPLRARVSALYLMVVTVIGAAFGPTSIALLTDKVFANPKAVGNAMALSSSVIGVIGCIVFVAGLGAFARVVEAQRAARRN